MPTDEALPYLQIEKFANGKSAAEAKKRAEKIKYGFKIEKNNLILDNYLVTATENKIRGQQVKLYLFLPKGTLFIAEKGFDNFDDSDNDFFNLHHSSSDYIYKVENDKVKCLNCPIYENDFDDIENNETIIDSNSTIIYDENGVLIKKEISGTKNNINEEIQNVKIEIDTKKNNNQN